MLALLLLQAVVSQTAVDAELAFNRTAQEKGQWTAFRAFAAEDATMFVPEPVKAQKWLKDREDPPKSVEWWPTESYVSCDGKLAVNTGGWQRPDGSVGYFTTVWQREADGRWKWIVDGGDRLTLPRSRPAEPKLVRAACTPPLDARVQVPSMDIVKAGVAKSSDGSLEWFWGTTADFSRTFTASLWDGKRYKAVISDRIAAPAK